MAELEVKGLKEAIANLDKIESEIKLEIGRKSLAAGLAATQRAIKSATYTTFKRQTGAIRSGFGIRVGHQLKGTTLSAVIVQYPQSVLHGAEIRAATARRQKRSSRSKKAVSLSQLAFWWKFLEFGTAERKSAPGPRTGKKISAKRLARFAAAASRGSVPELSWIRPAAAATAQQQVDVFVETMRQKIDESLNSMPKG